MRFREFMIEGDFSPSVFNLVGTLENLRNRTDQIRVDSLVKLVREKQGSEMFNVDILNDAFKNNTTVKNMIDKIDRNQDGVPYVFLKALVDEPEAAVSVDDTGVGGNQNTVSSMAKRAAKKRI